MARIRFVVALVVLGALAPAPVAPAPRPAALGTFVRVWIGHTRSLKITHRAVAKETIYDGCCTHVIDVKMRLSDVRGRPGHASARVTATAVHVFAKGYYSKKHPAPHVGEVRRIKLRHGVITEGLTDATYCNDRTGRKGICGA